MSLSFESAVSTLSTMFPAWEDDLLSTILISNDYHIERTIETLLSMGGEASPTVMTGRLSTYLYPTLILHIRRPQHAPASACALSSALARKKLPLGTPNLNIPQYTPAYQAPAPHAPPYTHTHSAHAARNTGIYGLADICVGKRLGAGVGGASESCGGARGVPPSPHMPLLAITKYAL
ncbi:hypothetical protein B484DRAFT_127455 [Ochromonadaceae sp. CCMP2298]|nr:hypothetical protein B484DRAFT_127455 [Ochromonadaceae sp. CCMP2298]